jgi:23S rRNA (adenine1618-N6)-methyltransferase
MLGKLSSVSVIVERLKQEGVRNWTAGELVQAGKTRRWVVAWSWTGLRPASRPKGLGRRAVKATANITGNGPPAEESATLHGGLLPFPPTFVFELHEPTTTVDALGRNIDAQISQLSLHHWQWKVPSGIGLGIARDGDCWSRKARRRKERMDIDKKHESGDGGDDSAGKEPAFAFKIRIISGRDVQDSAEGEEEEEEASSISKKMKGPRGESSNPELTATVRISIRWLQGQDHVLFESFCGWLRRKLTL